VVHNRCLSAVHTWVGTFRGHRDCDISLDTAPIPVAFPLALGLTFVLMGIIESWLLEMLERKDDRDREKGWDMGYWIEHLFVTLIVPLIVSLSVH
jgi:hypothetical protein